MITKASCIFLDLDGTLTSVEERYAKALKDAAASLGLEGKIHYSQYRTLQRKGLSGVEILAMLLGNRQLAVRLDRKRVERLLDPRMRRFDKLIPGAGESLDNLGREYQRIVITADKSAPRAIWKQLRSLGIYHMVEDVYSAFDYQGSITKLETIKARIISQHMHSAGANLQRSYMVGDTETDIRAAKECDLTSIAVLTGIRGREFLKREKADVIVENISRVSNILDSHAHRLGHTKTPSELVVENGEPTS